jgi:hypothetical protein
MGARDAACTPPIVIMRVLLLPLRVLSALALETPSCCNIMYARYSARLKDMVC